MAKKKKSKKKTLDTVGAKDQMKRDATRDWPSILQDAIAKNQPAPTGNALIDTLNRGPNTDTNEYYRGIGVDTWDPTFGKTTAESGKYLPSTLQGIQPGIYHSGVSKSQTDALVASLNANGGNMQYARLGDKIVVSESPYTDIEKEDITGNTDRSDYATGPGTWDRDNTPAGTGGQDVPGPNGLTYWKDDNGVVWNSRAQSYWVGSDGTVHYPNGGTDTDMTDGSASPSDAPPINSTSGGTPYNSTYSDDRFRMDPDGMINLLDKALGGLYKLAPEEIMQLYLLTQNMGLTQQGMDDAKAISDAMIGLETRKVDVSEELTDAQIEILNRQRDVADMSIEEYKTYGGPKIAEFLSRRPESLDYAAQGAAGGIQQQMESGIGQARRRMEGLGVDPSSGQYQRMLTEGYGPALAAAKVGAMKGARDKTRAANLGLLTDQANVGRGGQAAGLGALAQAGSTASGGLGLLGQAGNLTGQAGSILQGGTQSGVNTLNTGMGMAGNWMQNYLTSQTLMQNANSGGPSLGLTFPGGAGFEIGG